MTPRHDLPTLVPALYQHVLDNVKPERDQNNRAGYRNNWWVHGEPRRDMRPALAGMSRYIATVETTKRRVFQFLDVSILPDNMLIAIADEDAATLAVLSSHFHVTWALAAGGRLGVGNDPRYNKSRCLDPFPFQALSQSNKTALRAPGEQLDSHRKRQQAAHPKLTLTQMYNVLEKLRDGGTIEGKDREIYDQGLIGILRDLHDRIDAAVADAYGWPVNLSDEDILQHLVDLNRERADEEVRGLIRWLRPDYQNPQGRAGVAKAEQGTLDVGVTDAAQKAAWPATLPDQIAAVREALQASGEASPEEIARRFKRSRTTSVQPLLESLAALGQATALEGGRFAA